MKLFADELVNTCMVRKLYIVILVLFIGLPVLGQNRDGDIKFRLAQSYERSGNFESAVKLYEELYSKDSANLILLDALQRGYTLLKRYDDAIMLLQRRLNATPNDMTLLAQLGALYIRKSDEPKAIESWERAIAIEPKREGTYRLVASSMVESRLFDRAVNVYQRGSAACSDPTLFTIDLAYLYAIMLNYTEATREYVNLVRNNSSQLGLAQSQMSLYTSRANGLAAATVVVEQTVKTESNNLTLQQLLSWLYMEGKHFDKAYEVYKVIDEKTKAGGRELYNFGERALKEKAYAAASKAFLDVVNKYPHFEWLAQAKFGYARTLEESGAEHDTLNLFGNGHPFASKEHPESEAEPTYEGAIAAYNRVITDFPRTEVAARSLYRIAAMKHERFFDLDGARSNLETLIKNYPMFPTIRAEGMLRLGDVYLALGNLDMAENNFRSLSNQHTGFIEQKDKASLGLAELDYFRGKFQEALTKLQELTRNSLSDVTNDALVLQIFIQENMKSGDAQLENFAHADLLKRQRRLSEALSQFEMILQADSASTLSDETLMNIGDILAQMRKYSDAIVSYDRLIKNYPESLELDRAFIKIGQIYELGLNDKTKAIEVYQQLLEKFPSSIYVSEARKRVRELRGDSI
jgi:cellulose synthase operon protein C